MLTLLKKPYFQKLILAFALVVVAARVHWGLGLFAGLVAARCLVNIWDKPLHELMLRLRQDGLERQDPISVNSPELADLVYWINWKIKEQRLLTDKSEAQYQLALGILDELGEGVLVIDSGKHVRFVNRLARQMLGVSAIEPEGKQLLELIRAEQIHSLADRVLAGERSEGLDLRFEGGEVLTLHISAALFRGEHRRVLLVLHDVTQLRQTEQIRKDFVSNVSHELKTPLMAIAAAVETLLGGAVNDPQHNVGFLKTIEHHTQRLQYLIRDILTLSKIENALPSEETQLLSVADVVTQAIEDTRLLAQQNRLHLTSANLDNTLRVNGRASELRQVFINLIENAIRYTSAGGQLRVSMTQDATEVLVHVEDTGIGIAPEHLLRIFERFYRVDAARSRETGGTGLGLSIVKHIVQAHQGRIDVNSELGKGTVFTVRLPLVI